MPLDGWNMTKDGIPAIGTDVEILHFGNSCDMIHDTGTVDGWGIRPHATDGKHGRRGTVTHWRRMGEEEMTGEPRWYVVDKNGRANLAWDKETAEICAAEFNRTYPDIAPHRAVQLVDAAELESAYEQGWREAAEWANAGDLVCDIGSPAYMTDRARRIGR